MWKEYPLVILPTNEKANKGDIIGNDKGFTIADISYSLTELSFIQAKVYKLYILSDEEIKEVDWCMNPITKLPFQVKTIERNRLVYPEGSKKIIATTDANLVIDKYYPQFTVDKSPIIKYLPQLPQSFIKYFVSEYNKGNVITKVLVEYENYGLCIPCNKQGVRHCSHPEECVSAQVLSRLKPNPDNIINIKPIKYSWSREEVIELVKKAVYKKQNAWKIGELDKWIEENLNNNINDNNN